MTPTDRILAATLLVAASVLPLAGRAASPPLFTLIDGEALVLRAAGKFPALEGLPLRSDDIVHTGPATRLARIEFADGTLLDLGPGTRLLLRTPPRNPNDGQQAYLAQGWAKLTAPRIAPAGAQPAIASQPFQLSGVTGSVVVQVSADRALAFVETGQATLRARTGGPTSLPAGHSYTVRGDETQALPRPPADLARSLPRAFAASLPARAARYAGAQVAMPPATPVAYDDVADWIRGERHLRLVWRHRWAERAADPAFRARLVAGMGSHPEWYRVVYPPREAGAETDQAAPALGSTRPAGPGTAPALTSLLPYAGPASAAPLSDADRRPAPALPPPPAPGDDTPLPPLP